MGWGWYEILIVVLFFILLLIAQYLFFRKKINEITKNFTSYLDILEKENEKLKKKFHKSS